MSRDQLIVDEVAARLGAIQVANGYQTDAGLNVLIDAYDPDENKDSFPLLTLEDNEESVQEGTDFTDDMDGFDLQVQVYAYDLVPGGTSPGAHGRKLAKDIKNAVCDPTKDRRLPDGSGEYLLNEVITPVARVIELPAPGSSLVEVRVTFSAPYLELYGQTS